MARVERIEWDHEGEYNVKRLSKRKYLVCVEDSTCFLVYDVNSIDDAIKAVEEYTISDIEKMFT
jgi:hypothetical protein